MRHEKRERSLPILVPDHSVTMYHLFMAVPTRPRRLARPAIALLAATLGCSQRTAHDHPRVPTRIVTLTPSSTEIVAAVAGPKRIVGVDKYSAFPPEIVGRPVVGDFLNPSFEAILALRPDLVVMDSVQGKVAAGLADAGIPTLVLDMHTIEDVRAGILRVGAAVAAPERASALRADIDRDIAAVSARAAKRKHRLRVLAVVERQQGGLGSVIAAGPGSYIDELLHLVGANNVMAASTVRYSNITAEQILRGQPDVILDSAPGGTERDPHDWDQLSGVPAIEHHRIYPLTDPIYQSPSPRVGKAVRGLEAILYGAE